MATCVTAKVFPTTPETEQTSAEQMTQLNIRVCFMFYVSWRKSRKTNRKRRARFRRFYQLQHEEKKAAMLVRKKMEEEQALKREKREREGAKKAG